MRGFTWVKRDEGCGCFIKIEGGTKPIYKKWHGTKLIEKKIASYPLSDFWQFLFLSFVVHWYPYSLSTGIPILSQVSLFRLRFPYSVSGVPILCGAAPDLMGTSIPVISDTVCDSKHGTQFNPDVMLCVWGGESGTVGACNVRLSPVHKILLIRPHQIDSMFYCTWCGGSLKIYYILNILLSWNVCRYIL